MHTYMPETNLYRRDFSNFNEREFEETILHMNWNEICKLNQNDPSLSFHNFLTVLRTNSPFITLLTVLCTNSPFITLLTVLCTNSPFITF